MAEVEQSLPVEVPSLLIPMSGRPWLVPNIMVAEIIPLRQPDKVGEGPDWLVGKLAWRDEVIPLISYERLNDTGSAQIGSDARIAVLNNLTGKVKFYAILIQGIPRQSKINNDDLIEDPAECGPVDAINIQIGGELAVMPDLDAIEKAISELEL